MNLPAPAPASEPLRTVEFAPTDTLLREDVNMLGALVGIVVVLMAYVPPFNGLVVR